MEDTTTLSVSYPYGLLGHQSTLLGLRAYTAQEMSCTKVYLQYPGGDTFNSTIKKKKILTELLICAENLLKKRKTWPTFKDLMLRWGYRPHSQFVLIQRKQKQRCLEGWEERRKAYRKNLGLNSVRDRRKARRAPEVLSYWWSLPQPPRALTGTQMWHFRLHTWPR